MRIGYAKIGRSWPLDPKKASTVGGDIDVIRLLKYLATIHPEHEFVLIGRNRGENPQELGYPPNIVNPWMEWKPKWSMPTDPAKADVVIENFRKISGDIHKTLDHIILWAGDHGSANSRIPEIGTKWITPPAEGMITGGHGEKLATPLFQFMNYCSWLLDLISRWRELNVTKHEEIWLVPDPRNYLKCRELRWPLSHPVLAQYNMSKKQKHERYGRTEGPMTGCKIENSVWVSESKYVYAGVELTALPPPDEIEMIGTPGPIPFGMVINENRKGVKDQRLDVMKKWVTPYFPDAPIFGKWTEASQEELSREITPIPHSKLYETLKTFRTTFTTPASGSEWATSKAWECFANGSICFFHPKYDGQGNILPRTIAAQSRVSPEIEELAKFLLVHSPQQLVERVNAVCKDDGLWQKYAMLQRNYFRESWVKWRGGALEVEKRLGLA